MEDGSEWRGWEVLLVVVVRWSKERRHPTLWGCKLDAATLPFREISCVVRFKENCAGDSRMMMAGCEPWEMFGCGWVEGLCEPVAC